MNTPQGYPPQYDGRGYAPPPRGYGPQNTTAQDESHLNTLAILQYVYASLLVVSGFACGIYIVIGITVAEAIRRAPHSAGAPPAEMIGMLFTVIGGIAAVVCWTKAGFLFWAARSMQLRRRHSLCFVMACIECIAVPMGTLLGVFTIMTLNKPSVKALFTA